MLTSSAAMLTSGRARRHVDRAGGGRPAGLSSPSVRVLHPGSRFWPLLRDALDEAGGGGNLVLDAEIVAVCREHGVGTVLSEDRDFRRFPSVDLQSLPS